MFISFRFEAKQSEKRLFGFASKRNKAKKSLICFPLKRNEKIGSETKQNKKFLEAKQSENTVYQFCFSWKRKILSEKKRNQKIFACETDLVWLRFALKRKHFFAKPAHPN
jgi:hypothetical protein